MIPKRVKLSGFLCYKDEQEVAFDGSTLWMLAGMNGSGKSTIFDAVTYALFGHHRGGAQAAAELINKDSKVLSVDFEFTVDEQRYQIRRTLRRDTKGGAKGTQNVFRWDKPDDGEGKWLPVPDTNLSEGFKAWIRDKIGLNYDTFTSSVLLLQGRAEKLLDSKPSGRAEVLAGIVDLERYQHLHEKADAQRKTLKAKLEAIESQLTGIPEVTDLELMAAENRLLDAEDAKTKMVQEIECLQQLEFQAKQWTDLQTRLAEMRSRWDKAKTLIAESTAIEQSYQRYRTLKDVIPQVLIIQEKQSAIVESERRSLDLAKLISKWEADQTAHQRGIENEKLKREKLQKNLGVDEKHLTEVGVKLRALSGLLTQLNLYDVQTAKLTQLQNDLARLPKNILAVVREAENEYERKQELGRIVPLLERFAHSRTQLLSTEKLVVDLRDREQRTRERGEHAKKALTTAKQQLDTASQQRQKADELATEARTIYQQAKLAADDFKNMEGAKICRACGQPLTLGHLETEKVKRDKELKATAKKHKDSVETQQTALSVETAARDQFESADKELQKLREDYRDTKREWEQAEKDQERLINECRQSYLALPDNYRTQVAPSMPDQWAETSWPTANDLAHLRREAGDREAARSAWNEAREKQTRWEQIQAHMKSTQATLDQVKATLPPGDPAKLREQETNLKADEEATTTKVRSAKRQITEAEHELERLNGELEIVRNTLAQLASQINVEDATRAQLRDAIDRAAKLLPDTWRENAVKAGLAEQSRWKSELEELKRKKIEERYNELATMRAGIEAVREEMVLLENKANDFPTEAQCPPDTIKQRLLGAKKNQSLADDALSKAREEKAILDDHSKQRKQLREQTLELDKDLNFSTLLAQLLGRDRLQRHLVRTAERHIVDYANSILDRLSGGQLYLRLCGSEDGPGTERALELEAYNRQTGGNAINVAFLSGSQRFRVAVSLALGIGQYASKQHRPIESVIIDEGFGCLDRSGRQVMIQELQNLRGHLQCILLVSHQEEFADAFPDGYRFELAEGATKISRFQR